jgi:hypothetical protein
MVCQPAREASKSIQKYGVLNNFSLLCGRLDKIQFFGSQARTSCQGLGFFLTKIFFLTIYGSFINTAN